MADHTPVTQHVHACVKILNRHSTVLRNVTEGEARQAFEALFELVDMPWEDDPHVTEEWREGYETCMMDICDAIAVAWGVELPKLKVE